VFPHSRAIDEGSLEEERRLFYVGITRAMRQLYMTYARRRAVFGAQSFGMPSRFLDEIPGDLIEEPRRGGVPAGSGARAVSAGADLPRRSGIVLGQASWGGSSATAAEPVVARRMREAEPTPAVPPG
jgi:DNA helicase-2/ATP-dependent DNA helicase PcrA